MMIFNSFTVAIDLQFWRAMTERTRSSLFLADK